MGGVLDRCAARALGNLDTLNGLSSRIKVRRFRLLPQVAVAALPDVSSGRLPKNVVTLVVLITIERYVVSHGSDSLVWYRVLRPITRRMRFIT
jgi:hypothetical protein